VNEELTGPEAMRTELIRTLRRKSSHAARLTRELRELSDAAPPEQFRWLSRFVETQSDEMQKILIGYTLCEDDRILSDAAYSLVRQYSTLSGAMSRCLSATVR